MLIYFSLIILGGYLAVNHLPYPRCWRAMARNGVHDFGDPAVIPVAILVLSSYFLVMTPVVNTVIRTQEQEADVFGLNAARAPDQFAKIAMKLSSLSQNRARKEIIAFRPPFRPHPRHHRDAMEGRTPRLTGRQIASRGGEETI